MRSKTKLRSFMRRLDKLEALACGIVVGRRVADVDWRAIPPISRRHTASLKGLPMGQTHDWRSWHFSQSRCGVTRRASSLEREACRLCRLPLTAPTGETVGGCRAFQLPFVRSIRRNIRPRGKPASADGVVIEDFVTAPAQGASEKMVSKLNPAFHYPPTRF